MKGTEFPEATQKLLPPEGHEDAVYELPIWRHPNGGMVISKWGMTWKERWHCLIHGHVWFHCWGNSHPPMALETDYPFVRPESAAWKKLRKKLFYLTLAAAILLSLFLFPEYIQ